MSNRKRLSIRIKLTFLMASFALFPFILAFSYSSYQEIRQLEQQIIKGSHLIAAVTGDFIATDLLFDDVEAAKKSLAIMANMPDITNAAVYDRHMNLFTMYGQNGNVRLSHELTDDEVTITDNKLHIVHRIKFENDVIGFIYLQVSLANLSQSKNEVILTGSIVLILFSLLAIMLASWAQMVITRPVLNLAHIAKQIELDEKYDIEVTHDSNDEINELYHHFNNMIRSINKRTHQRDSINQELNEAKSNLELIVEDRTKQLQSTVEELEAFSYSVSHDLKAPLRRISGFSNILNEECSNRMSEEEKVFLDRIILATNSMSELIEDLLKLSYISRNDIKICEINLTKLCWNIIHEYEQSSINLHKIEYIIADNMIINGDPDIIKIAFENLLLNSIKYTSKTLNPVVEVRYCCLNDYINIDIVDNGAGFDMNYMDKLFVPFQRLHTGNEFEGTGIGLAIVKRVLKRHDAEISAFSEVGKGAVFAIKFPYLKANSDMTKVI